MNIINRLAPYTPIFIILLGIVPILAGIARSLQILGLPIGLPDIERILSSRTDILIVHITTGVMFCTLGAFQFSPRLRKRHPLFHRWAGRTLFAAAIMLGLSTLWLALFFPQAIYNGSIVKAVRLIVISSFLVMIVLGFSAVRRKDFVAHQAWMIRAMALSLGTGTQVYFFVVWMMISNVDNDLIRGSIFAFASALNLVIAERIVRRY